MAPLAALLLAALLAPGRACPEPCACVDKYAHQFADCAYKELRAVPAGLPANVTTLSLSANKIGSLPRGAFAEVGQVSSLWLAHNEIATIEPGALAVLAQLKNLDVSHNRIAEFPWQDLRNLSALQLLKMNHNRMASVPRDAFRALRDLRSLRINDNRFATLAEGIFDSLGSLSHLQIYNNPFECSCGLRWLKGWMESTLISIPEKDSIACALPERLRGVPVAKIPELACAAPTASLSYSPNADAAELPDGLVLSLHCAVTGSPPPEVTWKIRTGSGQSLELGADGAGKEEAAAPREPERFLVFKNGTLVIPRLSKREEGTYTCVATNELGTNSTSVNVAVAGAQKYPAQPPGAKGRATGDKGAEGAKNSVLTPEERGKALGPTRQSQPSSSSAAAAAGGAEPEGPERAAPFEPPGPETKCGSAGGGGGRYVSNHAFNQSGELKQHRFELGVIALDVAEREARVQLTPSRPPAGRGQPGVLYLCQQSPRGLALLQWSRIEDGVNSYRFRGLRPGTNYSVCLGAPGGDECQVQVVFSTKKEVPSLLVIVAVSVFLLLLATLPLLGAAWCHLLAKYRGKPYKLIVKARNADPMEKSMAADFDPRASYLESEKNFDPSGRAAEAAEEEEDDDEEEEDEEGGRVAAGSMAESQSKGGAEEFEVRSEYSDKLPLGAEAGTMAHEINGNY
ncbi:ISLR2 protein, partial [Malurus elegans]|nr:ISLR2 protein [Malurus elegans]